MSTTLGVGALGVYPLAGTFARAKPTVTVTSPTGTIDTTSVTFSFTYSSPVSRAQASYRAQLRTQDGSTILADTSTVLSASTSGLSISYLLSSGSSYQLWVQAGDGFDLSDWATTVFSVELASVANYPDNELVGSVYEIAINGVGYMLADDPDNRVERRSLMLEPPRLATSQTPFAEAVERYSFIGAADWSGGAGQKLRNREDSDPTKFWDSEGINPFDPRGLRLLNEAVASIADTYATPFCTVAGDRVYVCSADGELKSQATVEGAVTTFTITGAGAPLSLASDGTNWYYADGADIFRNSSAADPVSAWSTIDAELIEWTVDRLTAVYDDGAGNLCVTTLADAGTEEVAGGRFKYPDTVSIPAVTGGDGYLWFAVNRNQQSQVHYWQVGSSDTYAAVGLTLPAGQRAVALGFYLGNVFVLALEELASTNRAIVYRCVPQDGNLTAVRVLDFETTSDLVGAGFCGNDRFVFFTWPDMTEANSHDGLGCIDLSTGGYAKWFSSGTTGEPYTPVVWNGKLAWGIGGVGLYAESTDRVAEGWLESSISDLSSNLVKVFDLIDARFEPLASAHSVSMQYTVDGGSSYTSAGDTVDSAGAAVGSWDLGVSSRSFGYKITLGTSNSTTPYVQLVQTKLHPLSLKDGLLGLPVNCSTEIKGLNGQDLPEEISGMERVRQLEALIGTRVRLQDVDWPVTQTASIWEVVDVQGDTHGVFDRKRGRRVDTGRARVTLRRSL